MMASGFTMFFEGRFQRLVVLMKIATPGETLQNAEIFSIIGMLAILAGSVTLACAFPKKS